jgi:hypothetical protein
VGPREWQDWYRGLVKSAKLLERYGGKILVLSNVQVHGERHEADLYEEALKEILGPLFENNVIVIKEAQETIEQLEKAKRYSEESDMDLVVVSTFLHYLRVRWLSMGDHLKHHFAFGIPRPKEALTDIILTFLFPVIDGMGWREKFLDKVVKRRESGVH